MRNDKATSHWSIEASPAWGFASEDAMSQIEEQARLMLAALERAPAHWPTFLDEAVERMPGCAAG